MKDHQIIETVDSLQYKIYEKTECEYFNLSVTFFSGMVRVEFLGFCLWSSEDDMREYLEVDGEETDIYEPLEVFLRRRINREIAKLQLIKF